MHGRIYLNFINLFTLNCIQPFWKEHGDFGYDVYYAIGPVTFGVSIDFAGELPLCHFFCDSQKPLGEIANSNLVL